MPNETEVPNPAAISVSDLYERDDVENFTDEERRAMVTDQRAKRERFMQLEAEGKSVRTKKKAPAKAESVEDLAAAPVGEVK